MSKKIDRYSAQRIAHNIAAKAFEHMVTPAAKHLNDVALAAYFTELRLCGITPEIRKMLHERDVTGQANYRKDECTLVYATETEGASSNYRYTLTFPEGEPPLFAHMVLTNDYSKDQLSAAYQALAPLEAQSYALAYEVRDKITGKTTASVRKHWPEITGFVNDVMHEDLPNTSAIDPVPFQALLNKHLLALAAPTTTTTTTT